MAELIEYRMEIVGGPFDGTEGMRWRDDGEHPPPERVLLGTCPGDGSCGSVSMLECGRRRRAHPYFWLADEPARPAKTTVYGLQDSFVEPERLTRLRLVPGRAIYTIGGLLLPPGDELTRELPEEHELVLSGGHEHRLEEA